jgi:cellulose synthase/poly-beta-1,6-N-acetylglucosamine synthase-like glycosyltransferase
MRTFEVVFWAGAGLVVYTYALYPLLLLLLVRLRGRPVRRGGPYPQSVSIVLCAHNEEDTVDRRLRDLTVLLAHSGVVGEVILVCDGCTDATAAIARSHTKGPVRLVELPCRVGKAAALSEGAALARFEVLAFGDLRQTWDSQAIRCLLENFSDPEVGAVSGDLVIRDAAGVLRGVSLYWRYEKALRRLEGKLWSVAGTTGAICAVRRELFEPIPAGTVLDDVYWPLRVAMRGYRVVHDERAIAYDHLPPTAVCEFRRKMRTLAGNFQLIRRLPESLAPWRNPVALQMLSRKVFRLLVPWALLAMLFCSAVLPGALYRNLLVCQSLGYALGLLGMIPALAARSRLVAAASSFLVLNGAAMAGLWIWLRGRTEQTWGKVCYSPPSLLPAPKRLLRPNLVPEAVGEVTH